MMKLLFINLFMSLSPVLMCSFLIVSILVLLILSPHPLLIMSTAHDFLSFSLALLSLWLILMMLLAFYQPENSVAMSLFLKLLTGFLIVSFLVPSKLMFYFFFEASLIPIFGIIMGWGYQPERLTASLWMLFYTLTLSLPLLLVILNSNMMTFSFSFIEPLQSLSSNPILLSLMMMGAFLVKFPMYGVHLWLPKAHVEAPVSGSMILAGVLLKLGGYGLFRLSSMYFLSSVNFSFAALSMAGGGALAIMCSRMSDMKVMIAYSSVVHMALVILSLMTLEKVGLQGAIWMMIAHGIVSSGLFAGANMMYEQSHSRSLLVNKGMLSKMPEFSLFWFFLLMANFGGPFTVNLYSEIILIQMAVSVSLMMAIPIILLSFFSAAYSLVLYSSSQQGLTSFTHYNTFKLTFRELSVLSSHAWPVVALLLNLTT